MNNTEWITDRLPTPQDGDYYGQVWDSTGSLSFTHEIAEGEPWVPSNCPGPYVKPKRFEVRRSHVGVQDWGVYTRTHNTTHMLTGVRAIGIPTLEAAERIAAIYEEVVP